MKFGILKKCSADFYSNFKINASMVSVVEQSIYITNHKFQPFKRRKSPKEQQSYEYYEWEGGTLLSDEIAYKT